MKKFLGLFLIATLFSLTSCLNIIEEMKLNKNGSGKYILTFDMSDLLKDEFTKNMFNQMLEEQGGIDGNSLKGMDMDTLIYFKDMPAEERKKLNKPEFWDQVLMRMNMSEQKKQLTAKIELDFKSVADIQYFYENLDKITANSDQVASNMANGGLLPSGAAFLLKKNTLKRLPGPEMKNMFEGEEMEFVKMFFAESIYKTIYTMPGRVKKTTIEGAKVQGNTITVSSPMLDVFDGKVNLDGDIKFKK